MRRCTVLILSMIVLLSFSTMAMTLSCSGSCKKDRCLLCGIPDVSVSMDSAPDGVGILNFNDFSINTLRICRQEPDASGYASNMDSPKGSGSAVRIDSNLDRRIAEVTISIRKGSRPLYKKCQDLYVKTAVRRSYVRICMMWRSSTAGQGRYIP